MTTLHSSKKRELRARAHALRPVVMIGDDGLTPGVLAEIERSLNSHELIKIRVLGGDRDQRNLLLEAICTQASAQQVQHIGKMLVVYRERPVEPARPRPARPARSARPAKAARSASARFAPSARRQDKGAPARGPRRPAAAPRSRAAASRGPHRDKPGPASPRPPRRPARAR